MNEIRFRHLPALGKCIAYQTGVGVGGTEVKYAETRLHPFDQYEKAKARLVSSARLKVRGQFVAEDIFSDILTVFTALEHNRRVELQWTMKGQKRINAFLVYKDEDEKVLLIQGPL